MFKELIKVIESKKPRSVPMIFELIVDGSKVATNSNADVIGRKAKAKKYIGKEVKIMRSSDSGYEDITDMFL